MPGLGGAGPSRANNMFVKMGLSPPKVKCEPRPKKMKMGVEVEEDDDVSSITGSEMFALNPDFLSSQSKCQSWLEQQTLEAPPSDPGLPQKEVVKKQPLVPYTPSASSTSTRCTRTREEEGRISSPSSRFARAVLRQGNLKQFYGLSKRLGYSNPPRQIALISEAEKENHVVPFPSISSGNSAKRKCLGNKTDLAEASIPSNLCDTPIPGPSTTQGSMTDLVGLGGLSNVVPHTFTNPEPSSKAYRRSSRARNISTVIVSERACSSPQNKCQTATAVNLLSMDGNDESESTTKKSSELLDSPIAPILASKKLHQKLLQKTPSNQPPTVHCSSVLPADNCTSPVKDKSTRNNTDLVEASAPSNKGDTPTIPTTTDLSATPRRRRSSRKRTTMSSSVDLISDSDESLFHGGTSEDSFKVDNPSSSSSESTNSDCSSHSVHDVLNRKTHSSKSRNLEIAEMDDSDDERPTVPQKKIRKRRKGAKCSREERSRKKYLRNSGQEYEKHDPNSKTPVRAARQRKPPHTCKTNYCQDIITDDVGDSIFHEYWDQQSYEKRVSYVCARVEIKPVKTKRPRLPAGHKKSHPKSVSHKYCFHIHGESKQVCKSTFLNTLGETDGFVYLATKKKLKSLSGTVAQDKRGRHAPKHKLKPDVIDEVKTHVLRFPSYKSHYKRSEVGDTRYLPSHLDIRQMYNMYISEGHKYVSYSTYERIFNTLGRSFKKPATDTCSKCDTWNQMIKEETDDSKRKEIEELRDAHLDRAQAGYDLKKSLKIDAQTDLSLRVLVFDLEQVLETPLLSTGAAFYLRQLSTFNLTIYDCTTKVTHCYMWCEVDGNRGANEIASCLFYHCLDVIPETVKKVVFFSDSCSGQNRNSIVAAMFLTMVQMHTSVQTVEHVFLEAGHTRMEVDSKHSVIERKKKHCDSIYLPSDWYNAVRDLGAPSEQYPLGKFVVTEMKGQFYDFEAFLKGPLVLRHVTTQKEKFLWTTTPLLRYDANKQAKVFFKKNLQDKGYCCIDFQRRGKAGAYADENLAHYIRRCHLNPLPISKEKKTDLMKLLPLIPTSAHEFYKSLPTHDGNDDCESVAEDCDEDVEEEISD